MGEFTLVITTGGTIACTQNASGALVPTRTAAELVAASGSGLPVRTYDAASLDSSSVGLGDIDMLRGLVSSALDDASVSSVVVTHGTDSLAETALALDLVHDDPRPVVLTGAMRPADHPHPDGPENLRRAIDVAADRLRRGTGVLVHFGGETLPARGLQKVHTSDLHAFALASERPLPRPVAVQPAPLAPLRIPIIRAWAGADAELVRAAAQLNPDGVVVEALGAGNVSDAMGEAIAGLLSAGVPVVVASSVPNGEVAFEYGGAGGGSTLGALGAIPAGFLRAGQARIALATALSSGVAPQTLF